MKTKNIFKALAFALLMPAMLLTTACSSDNDVITNNENINKKGYEIPVTLNATRQGDATTRATYNPDTKKLEYSTGDQLYVLGNHSTAGMFYGTLDWEGGIIFSGTITTTNQYSGSGVELLSSAIWARATLLPAGYNNYNYLDIVTQNPFVSYNYGNTFATSKTTAIEQFSNESAIGYNNGFALAPQNAILNFTITGLTPNTEFAVELWNSYYGHIEGNVTTNGSGTATFAIGIDIVGSAQYHNIDNLYDKGWDLRIKDNNNHNVLRMYDDNNPLVTSSTPLVAGHIYNITRSAASVPTGALSGLFTISDDNGANTRQVYFSQGNLQAVFASAGSTCTWKFADNQWDYIGGRSYGGSETQTGNNFINGNGSVSAAGTVDLFGWSTSATYYGIHNSNSPSTYSGDFVDWGATMGTGWFTLETNEWVYLFYTRTASTVGGTANGRYAAATVNSVAGVILFPDSYTHPSGVTVPVSVNDAEAAYTVNSYSGADWTAMENAGAVFLPAAGNRGGSSVYYGSNVYYWSSSPYNTNSAYNVYFQSGWLELPNSSTRDYGYSVRLVHE